MDNQFECLREQLTMKQANLIVCSEDEHVGHIERLNRTIQERVRSVYTTLPYKRMPGRMVVGLVHFAIFWLNTFPATPAVCAPLSPRALITGKHIDYNHYVRLEFGEYVHTHESHGSDQQPRTVGAIALWPTGNEFRGHYFMSLLTGRRLICNRWTELPLPQDIIKHVNHLAQRNLKGLIFSDRSGQPLMAQDEDEINNEIDNNPATYNTQDGNDDDDDNDSSYSPDDNDSFQSDTETDIAGVSEYEENDDEPHEYDDDKNDNDVTGMDEDKNTTG
eukprot:15350056-Ditylum_brightwellii.AAC.1